MAPKKAAVLSLGVASLCLGTVAIWRDARASDPPPIIQGPLLVFPHVVHPPWPPPDQQVVAAETLVRAHSPVLGPESAPVTIVEFLDPQGKYSSQVHPAVKDAAARHGDRVRLVIRYLPFGDSSVFAAASLEEARAIGKFEEALDLLLLYQRDWGSDVAPKPALIVQYLGTLGVEAKALERPWVVVRHLPGLQQDKADVARIGIHVEPAVFVNGVWVPVPNRPNLEQVIASELRKFELQRR